MSVTPIAAAAWPAALTRLIEELTGQPLAEVGWRELVRARDVVERALNLEIARRQAPSGGDAA